MAETRPSTSFVWYFIALQTLVEPAFYQRAFAAKDEKTAQRGVIISIGFWMLFDFLTTFTGMYARALMPNLPNPVTSYPSLAIEFLPPVVKGLFLPGTLATVMSTVDGYTFIGGVNFGRDLVWRLRRKADESRVNFYSQFGFVVTGVLAVAMALFFRSAVDLWHDVGSVVVAGAARGPRQLVQPALPHATPGRGLVHRGERRGRADLAPHEIPRRRRRRLSLGIEPIYVGLTVSLGFWLLDRVLRKRGP